MGGKCIRVNIVTCSSSCARQDRKLLFAEAEGRIFKEEYQEEYTNDIPRTKSASTTDSESACARRIGRAHFYKDIFAPLDSDGMHFDTFQMPTRIMPRVITLSCIFTGLFERGALNNNRHGAAAAPRATSARWKKLKSISSPRALGFSYLPLYTPPFRKNLSFSRRFHTTDDTLLRIREWIAHKHHACHPNLFSNMNERIAHC